MTKQPEMPESRFDPSRLDDLNHFGPEEKNAMPGSGPGIITFKRSAETEGWPDPVIMDSKDLSDSELAAYIEVCGTAYDGIGDFLRDAIVRVLRR